MALNSTFLKIIILLSILLLSSCESTSSKLWSDDYYTEHEFIQGACLLPQQGLLAVGLERNYLITRNYQQVIDLNRKGKFSDSDLKIDDSGHFSGTLTFSRNDSSENVHISGHTLKVTNAEDLHNMTRAIRLSFRHVPTPLQIGGKVILTPVTISYDTAKAAGMTGMIIIASPVIIKTIIDFGRRW